MAKNAEDKQKWLDAILREREQRESKWHFSKRPFLLCSLWGRWRQTRILLFCNRAFARKSAYESDSVFPLLACFTVFVCIAFCSQSQAESLAFLDLQDSVFFFLLVIFHAAFFTFIPRIDVNRKYTGGVNVT